MRHHDFRGRLPRAKIVCLDRIPLRLKHRASSTPYWNSAICPFGDFLVGWKLHGSSTAEAILRARNPLAISCCIRGAVTPGAIRPAIRVCHGRRRLQHDCQGRYGQSEVDGRFHVSLLQPLVLWPSRAIIYWSLRGHIAVQSCRDRNPRSFSPASTASSR